MIGARRKIEFWSYIKLDKKNNFCTAYFERIRVPSFFYFHSRFPSCVSLSFSLSLAHFFYYFLLSYSVSQYASSNRPVLNSTFVFHNCIVLVEWYSMVNFFLFFWVSRESRGAVFITVQISV